jgi:kumamolisin
MNDRKTFSDSVTPLPDQPGLGANGLMFAAANPEHHGETRTLLFSLGIPPEAQAQLEARVAGGEIVPSHELQSDYAASANDVESLVAWLQAQGFEITQVSKDGTSVYARAGLDTIAQSLGVKMVRVTKDGLTYTAAQNAPSLPADVGKGVHAIIGLQPFRQAHKHSRKRLPRLGNRTSSPPPAAAAPGLTPNVDNSAPYLVAEVLKAYNADALPVTGQGQTIAILIDTFPADADLQSFWDRNGLGVTLQQIEKVNVNGGPLPATEGEETLDVEWSSGIAPGATVRIYATGSLQFVDLDRALDAILADLPNEPGLRQLSISLGLGETFMGGPQGEVAVQHQKFLRLAAAGVNVFVSSGDAGSNPDDTGHGSTGPIQAEYESSDPFVIGVGGTTLTLAPDGTVASEQGWAGSGGGKSIFFSRPVWQTSPGVPAGNERLVPDVSLAADPDKGAFLVLNQQVVQIGGTSWSAPVWAGFCALINEARAKAGKPGLPFLNPILYPLAGTACFRDIRTGSNGAFSSGPGYDLVTGIGVPNVAELIRALTQ